MKNKIPNVAEAAWLLGIILCGLGVCLSVKSDFGVSMVIAPAYIIYLKLSEFIPWFTLGMAEYSVQGILIVVLSVALRRFKFKYLLCFLTSVIHGAVVDIWSAILEPIVCETVFQRSLCCAAGAVITSFAIALMLRTYLPQEVYELVVKEISDKFGFSVNRVKWIYDASSLLVAVILMFSMFGRFSFDMIGIGTLVLTFFNTPLITLAGRLLDKFFNFTPAFSGFFKKFDRVMN